MYHFFLALYSIFGVMSLATGTYVGLALGGLVPTPYDPYGNWIIAISPVVLGALGVIFIFLSFITGSRLTVKGWRDDDSDDQE
jgi:hypothetical protein